MRQSPQSRYSKRRSSLRSCLFSLALAGPLLGIGSARGADPRDVRVRRYAEAGMRLFTEGLYQEALSTYERAYKIKPLPRFLFAMGKSHQRLGHVADALRCFEDYLRLEPDTKEPLREEAQNIIQSLPGYSHRTVKLLASTEPEPRPPEPAPVVTPLVVPPPAPVVAPARPLYRRPWFLGAVGGGAAAALTLGLGLGLGLRRDGGPTLPGGYPDPVRVGFSLTLMSGRF